MRPRPAAEDGFTVVELLVAALVLVVGMGGIFAVVTGGQRANLRAQRQAQAADIGQLEIQKARSLAFANLGLTTVPLQSTATGNDAADTSNNPANPNWWVRGSGASTTLLIRSSYRDTTDTTRPAGTPAGGEPILTGGSLAPGPETVTAGTTTASVYRYVTARDETCATGCAGTAETKRVTIAVVLAPSRGDATPKPYWISTIVSDPNPLMTRSHDDAGFALVTTIIVLAVAAVLAAALSTATLQASKAALGDRQTKAATAAADAGLDAVRDVLFRVKPSGSTPCLAVAADGTYSATAAANSTWCPPLPETLGDGTRYSVTLGVPSSTGARLAVSVGTAGAVSRRKAVELTSASGGTPLFGNYGLSSIASLSFNNGARFNQNVAAAYGAIRTNGSITLSGGATMGCGALTPGSPNKVVLTQQGETWCGRNYSSLNSSPPAEFTAAPPFTYPAVDMGTSATVNDNARITNCNVSNTDDGVSDWCPGKQYNSNWVWNASQKSLKVTNGTNLTLRGGVYYFCRLEVTGQQIIIPSNVATKIYVDSAANCPSNSYGGAGVLNKVNGGDFVNQSQKPENLQIYVNGASTVTFDNNSGTINYLTLFAPDSTVTLGDNTTVTGAIAGKAVTMRGGGNVQLTDGVKTVTTAGSTKVSSANYRDCVTRPGDATTDGCTYDAAG